MGFMDRMKDMQGQAQQAMQQGGGMSAAMGGGNMAEQAAYAQTAQKLHAQGVEAPGVIHSLAPTGQTDMGGGQQIAFEVSIRPAGADPFQTTIKQSMLPAQLEDLHEGSSITVKYDPDSPTTALIYGW